MVLYITCVIEFLRKLTLSSRLNTLDFSHDHLKGLSHDVGQHVESTTVRHTNNELVCAILYGSVDSDLQAWDERVATLKAESLFGIKLLGHKSTEVVGPLKTVVQVKLLLISHTVVLNTFEVDTNPVTNISLGDV